MKYIKLFLVLFFSLYFTTAFGGDKKALNNKYNWTQCSGIPNIRVSGIGKIGNTLIAGAFTSLYLPYAYIAISTDDGVNWTLTDSLYVYNHQPGTTLWFNCWISFLTNGTKIFAGIGDAIKGDIYLSTDNGFSWSHNGITWNENRPFASEDINSFTQIGSNLFAGTNYGVFVSKDNGQSWNSTDTSFSYQVMRIAAIGTNLFAGTTGNGIFRSKDNGVSWDSLDNGLTNTHIYGLTATGTSLYAGGFQFPRDSTGGVFISSDYGENWNIIDTGLTDHKVNLLYTDGSNLYAGTNNSVYVSTNYGQSWINISSGSPFDSNAAIISITVADSSLIVGTNGYGAWRFPLSQLVTGINDRTSQLPSSFSLQQNYPNPFNPTTVICYSLPVSSYVSLNVYDVLGREVGTLVNEEQNAGTHNVTFNAGNLTSGVYYYRLTTGNFVDTKKLMLIK